MARSFRTQLAVGLTASLLLGGLTPSTRVEAADGTVWALRGASSTIYLAGSVHLLRADDAELPPALLSAYADAEALVMEVDMDDLDPMAAARFTQQYALFTGDAGLRTTLGEVLWTRASAAGDRLGIPLQALDRLEPWAVALLLSVTELTQTGLDPQFGVEEQLKRRAGRDGKPITGLETIEYQLGLFDALDMAAQARFLDLSLRAAADVQSELATLTRAWREGRVAELERVLLQEYATFPELYEALIYRRNRAWIPRLRALTEGSVDTLVVVGAMHLIGERGVIALLRGAGLDPQPLRLH